MDTEGDRLLKISVTAAPENGKANKALIKLLSKLWKIPRTAFTFVGGAKNRNKTLLINGEPATLLEKLNNWSETDND